MIAAFLNLQQAEPTIFLHLTANNVELLADSFRNSSKISTYQIYSHHQNNSVTDQPYEYVGRYGFVQKLYKV